MRWACFSSFVMRYGAAGQRGSGLYGWSVNIRARGLLVVDCSLENFCRVSNMDVIDATLDAIEADSVAEEFHLNLQFSLPWPTSLKLKNAPLVRLASIPVPRAPFPPPKVAVTTSSILKNVSTVRLARAVALPAPSQLVYRKRLSAPFSIRRY